MNDPMLSSDPQEREKYSTEVMDAMKKAIEEDRTARRQVASKETPATIIGAMGMSSGLNQSL